MVSLAFPSSKALIFDVHTYPPAITPLSSLAWYNANKAFPNLSRVFWIPSRDLAYGETLSRMKESIGMDLHPRPLWKRIDNMVFANFWIPRSVLSFYLVHIWSTVSSNTKFMFWWWAQVVVACFDVTRDLFISQASKHSTTIRGVTSLLLKDNSALVSLLTRHLLQCLIALWTLFYYYCISWCNMD